MAELNTGDSGGGKKGGKVRSKKGNNKVDLTAMVDLAFLLITFFMLTTSLSKPKAMPLNMPAKDDEVTKVEDTKVDENATLTLLLGENDKVVMFKGLATAPLYGPKTVVYGKDGLRKELIDKMKEIADYTATAPKAKLTVIIKPTKKSKFKNMVDVLDEMEITQVGKVGVYAIVNEFDPLETKMLEGTSPSAPTTQQPNN